MKYYNLTEKQEITPYIIYYWLLAYYEFKLHYVEQVFNNHQIVEDVSKLYGFHHTALHNWIQFYEKHGEKALLSRETKVYGLPFKIKIYK
jgi:transposase